MAMRKGRMSKGLPFTNRCTGWQVLGSFSWIPAYISIWLTKLCQETTKFFFRSDKFSLCKNGILKNIFASYVNFSKLFDLSVL